MATSTEISLTELPSFGNQLARGVLGGDYSPAMKKVAIAAKADFKRRFETATAPDGSPWPPIKGFRVRRNDAYARPRGRGTAQTLRNTGLLEASVAASGKGHVEDITSVSMEVGTNLDRAAIHQEGVPSNVWDGRPTRARALAIPMTLEAERAGSPRLFPVKLQLIWPKGKSTGWLVQVVPGRRSRSIMHYMLTSKVVIPQRKMVGWSPALIQTTDHIVAEHMMKLANGNGG